MEGVKTRRARRALAERIEQAREAEKQAQEARKRLEQKLKTQQRQESAKLRFIIGEAVLAMMDEDERLKSHILSKLDNHVERESDRRIIDEWRTTITST